MKSVSDIDASFLYLEKPNTPLHIGSVGIYDVSTSDISFDFPTFRKFLSSRLHLNPALRQRLVSVPLDIDHPYWVEDQNFNLNLHLRHMALPKPGGWQELAKLMAREMSRHMGRAHPLWSLVFVQGLDSIDGVPSGSIAIISKIHPAGVEVTSGADVIGDLLSTEPEPQEFIKIRPQKWNTEEMPSSLRLLASSGIKTLKNPFRLPRLISQVFRSVTNIGASSTIVSAKLPDTLFTAPRTRFNAHFSPRRVWDAVVLPLEKFKAIRNTVKGMSVNDVIVAVCAGALRKYLMDKGELPTISLVAMVPVAIRQGKDGHTMFPTIVQLATNECDSARRLERIHENILQSKIYQKAIGAKTLTDYRQFVPFSMATMATRFYPRILLDRYQQLPFNLIITNVPGPQDSLYLGTSRLLTNMGAFPIVPGMGLAITIFSYSDSLMVSATSCPEMMPDVDLFMYFIQESLDELEP
ncbi:MAG: hypothetical protein B6242_06860 [Anaerolineaceae bacterium 4572_78]|nr:MAG: hypothetical protein B6242_06860 [Anaerolineaceae bacterium 4572_78]